MRNVVVARDERKRIVTGKYYVVRGEHTRAFENRKKIDEKIAKALEMRTRFFRPRLFYTPVYQYGSITAAKKSGGDAIRRSV